MTSISNSVTDTLTYSKYFHYPLGTTKLHTWLISSRKVSLKLIQEHYPQVLNKAQRIFLNTRARISADKISQHSKLFIFLNKIPTILGVFVTGSVSVENAREEDDLDLMIVTRVNTLWLTRLLIVPFLKLFFSIRSADNKGFVSKLACLNLWLDEQGLLVPKSNQSLYTAHEVLQVKPIIDKNQIYQRFIQSNSWTKSYLANAYHQFVGKPIANKLHDNQIIGILNGIAFLIQKIYMSPRRTREHLTQHSAYFHPLPPPTVILKT